MNLNEKIDLKTRMSLAISLFGRGQVQDALDEFSSLTRMFPTDADLLYNYGYMLGSIGQVQEEQQIYQKLIALGHDSYDVLVNYSISLNSTENFVAAASHAAAAIEKVPDLPNAYEALGISLMRQGKLEEGRDNFKSWLRLLTGSTPQTAALDSLIQHCVLLMGLPAVYKNARELRESRQTFKSAAESVERIIRSGPVLKSIDPTIRAQIAFKLSGFGIPYQQLPDDRADLERLARITESLLSSSEKHIFKSLRSDHTLGVISTFTYHPSTFILDQLRGLPTKLKLYLVVLNNQGFARKVQGILPNCHVMHVVCNPFTLDRVISDIQALNLRFCFLPEIGLSAESRVLACFRLGRFVMTSWLHPVTSGSRHVDFFLSGRTMESSGSEGEYTERLIKLPKIGLKIDFSRLNDVSRNLREGRLSSWSPSTNSVSHRDARIGLIQQPHKYHPDFDCLLVSVVRRLTWVRFFILEGKCPHATNEFKTRIESVFKASGLVFLDYFEWLPAMEQGEYFEFLGSLDAVIDSVGWSGGNTSLDCLFVGVPVFTTPLSSMRSRHTFGIYQLIDEHRFYFSSDGELIDALYEFCTSKPSFRADIKVALRQRMRLLKTRSELARFVCLADAMIKI